METRKNWVDYKKIKATVTMEMVLKHYRLFDGLTKEPDKNALGPCPIHNGKNPRHLSVCLEKNIWRCFGECDSGGNILDFVSKMEKCTIREAALFLEKHVLDQENEPAEQKEAETKTKEETKKDPQEVIEKKEEEEETGVNPPLSFVLKSLDTEHPFFAENGIREETVEQFGMGYCNKGIMKGRIAIPIHDHQGQLVAYAGLAVSQEQAEEEGSYKFPKNFCPEEIIFNLHRQEDNEIWLLIAEDPLAAILASQSGFRNTVALMTPELGLAQEEAIIKHLGPTGRLTLLYSERVTSQERVDLLFKRLSSKIFTMKAPASSILTLPTPEPIEQIAEAV